MFIYNTFILQARFFPFFQFLCCIQRNCSRLISKQLESEDFLLEKLPVDSYMLNYANKIILFQLINKSLVFDLIAI